jgi:hypothetical protein
MEPMCWAGSESHETLPPLFNEWECGRPTFYLLSPYAFCCRDFFPCSALGFRRRHHVTHSIFFLATRRSKNVQEESEWPICCCWKWCRKVCRRSARRALSPTQANHECGLNWSLRRCCAISVCCHSFVLAVCFGVTLCHSSTHYICQHACPKSIDLKRPQREILRGLAWQSIAIFLRKFKGQFWAIFPAHTNESRHPLDIALNCLFCLKIVTKGLGLTLNQKR